MRHFETVRGSHRIKPYRDRIRQDSSSASNQHPVFEKEKAKPDFIKAGNGKASFCSVYTQSNTLLSAFRAFRALCVPYSAVLLLHGSSGTSATANHDPVSTSYLLLQK